MATTAAQQAARHGSDDDTHPFLEWVRAKQRPLSYALGAVILVGLVAWYMVESGRRKQIQANEAMDRARAAIDAGSYPEASTELQRITQVYGGTDAAFDAELSLNQVRMLSGQSQLAVDELKAFIAKGPPAKYRSLAQTHLGMALENLGQFKEAAEAYHAAADPSQPEYVQGDALLSAARCERLAGESTKAAETLEGIIKRLTGATAATVEAKVRLAELTGGR